MEITRVLRSIKGFRAFAAALLMGAGAAGALRADVVTLPVAASLVGKAPFFSDVRVFNTSYTDVMSVTATYRCTVGSAPGCGTQPAKVITLGPREARGFDDICVSLFGVANSLGAVEFEGSGLSGQLVVTSRLYSPASVPPWPAGTVGSVGMFIPGLPTTAAHAVTLLTNLSNGGSGTGSFRTNVGVYNGNDVSVVATIKLYEDVGVFPPVLLGVKTVTLGGRNLAQLSDIYGLLGAGGVSTTTGYATVESDSSSHPLFTYAATADNTTQDPVLVVGAEDVPAPPDFTPPTPTPTTSSLPTSTPTPTPGSPTATPTPTPSATIVVSLVATCSQWNFNGAGNGFTMHVGQMYELHVRDGDDGTDPNCKPHGFPGIPLLGIPAMSPLQVNGPDFVVTVTPNSSAIGTTAFACDQQTCSVNHDQMVGFLIVQ